MIPGLSVVWVVIFVLVLSVVLDRWFFKPLVRVMQEREGRVKSALDLAHQSAEKAKAATTEFDARVQAAQAEIYREMDERRRAALDKRQELLASTRREVEASVADATARIKAEAEQARQQLAQQADALGAAMAERVLGRRAS